MKINKTKILSISISVIVSTLLVAGVVLAVTTVGTKVTIGSDTGTNAVALSHDATTGDFGLETYTKLDSDMAGGWYAASNSYMTVSASQGVNTSVFGSISELDLSTVTLSTQSNHGAIWGDLEILGTTVLGAGGAGTPLYSGAVIASLKASSDTTVSDYRELAGIVVDSSMASAPTIGTGASISGILIRRTPSAVVWPVGLKIESGSVTTDIELSSGAKILTGTTDPNGSVTAANGSVYIRAGTGNEDTTIYTNTDGGTTWAPADL